MLAAGAVALLAWGARSLTTGGAVAAWLVGIAVLVGTGWAGGAVLAAFFVSSSGIGRLAPAPAGLDPKGERRDPWQVAANGGPAAWWNLDYGCAVHHKRKTRGWKLGPRDPKTGKRTLDPPAVVLRR